MKSRKGLIRCIKKGAKHFKYIYVRPEVVNNSFLMEQLGLEVCEEKDIIFASYKNIPNYVNQ